MLPKGVGGLPKTQAVKEDYLDNMALDDLYDDNRNASGNSGQLNFKIQNNSQITASPPKLQSKKK